MIDEYFVKIKNRMLIRSKELWGIKDIKNIDPILDLLLHTFSYEISKLHQQIDLSDKEILHKLSRILVSNKWILPLPSHALLKAQPEENITELKISDHFFCTKRRFGEKKLDVFFTPIIERKLINAAVKLIGYDTAFFFENQFNEKERYFNLSDKERIKDYEFWFGIDISDSLLETIEDLSLCFTSKDNSLLPFLKTMQIFDVSGNSLNLSNEKLGGEGNAETHYFNEVVSFYEDSFYNLKLATSNKTKKAVNELFSVDEDIAEETKKLLWFKVRLPEVFSKEKISGIDVSLNTFPVVNRKLESKQHNFKKNGKILSILNGKENYFLNIEELVDNNGNQYTNIIDTDTNVNKSEGSYSLYFGDIGRFDTRSAKMLLSKTFQTVREEGSAFSAVGYDIIQAYLVDLHNKLDEITKKIDTEFGDANMMNSGKTFLLTHPYKDAFNYEFKFWLTNADQANDIDRSHTFSQYKTGKFKDDSIVLKTPTLGGIIREEEQDKINGLRYGLLTRERIVTREDAKSFVRNKIGDFIEDITIKDGVMIAKEKKKGLARTTELRIKTNDKLFSEERKELFSYYLEKELEKKSISNIIYKVFFI